MLSIIIPAFNSASTISHTLSSIFSTEFPRELFEVLVIDNGSSDKTVELSQRYSVKIYHCPERGRGPPKNLGIKMAKGDIFCFTDSDCIVEKDWLEKITSFLEQHPEADGVGGPVFPYRFSQNRIQKLTGELFVEKQGYPREVRKVKYGSMSGLIFGSNSAYRKDAVTSVGGYGPGGHNLELMWRLISMKKNLFFNPEMKVSHIFPSNLKSIFEEQFRWGAQWTQMKRIHRLDKGPIETINIFYIPIRCLLSLVHPKNSEIKLLQFTELASNSLGRIYGYHL